jgi:LAS superfamily LD-carboxypeptidase LdcB
MTPEALTGRSDSHIVSVGLPPVRIHREMSAAWENLVKKADAEGFKLRICSGFRDFGTQLKIWNEKVQGIRPVLDASSKQVDRTKLPTKDLIYAILRWSALPGASRHHWGTDIDIFDAAKMREGYKIQLVPEEYEEGGIFGEISQWLDENMKAAGFYRPYDEDRGGISPERWHISYAPLAEQFEKKLTVDLLRETLANSSILLKNILLTELDEIYKRFVTNIAKP